MGKSLAKVGVIASGGHASGGRVSFRSVDIDGPTAPLRPVIGKPKKRALDATHTHVAAIAEMFDPSAVTKNQSRRPRIRNFTGCGKGINNAEQVGDGVHSP